MLLVIYINVLTFSHVIISTRRDLTKEEENVLNLKNDEGMETEIGTIGRGGDRVMCAETRSVVTKE